MILFLARQWRLLLALIGIPIIVLGVARLETNIADVFQWLPEQSASRQVYDWFVEEFGTDDFVFVSWPGATLENDHVAQLDEAIVTADESGHIQQVTTGREMLDRLTAPPIGLSSAEAHTRLQEIFIGPENDQTGLLIRLTDKGMRNRIDALQTVFAAAEQLNLRDDLKLSGYPFFTLQFDKATRQSLLLITGPAILVSTLLAWLCLKNVREVLLVFLVALAAMLASVSLVTLTGTPFNSLMPAMPTLIYVLTVSGAIHVVNYYRPLAMTEAVASQSFGDKQRSILSLAWRPCLASAASTAIGLGALLNSDFPAIRTFGLYSSAGVLCSFAVLLIYLPPGLAWATRHEAATTADAFKMHRWQQGLFSYATSRHKGIVWTTFVLAAGGALFIPHLKGSGNLEQHFTHKDNPFRSDARWIEQHLGPTEPFEVVLEIPIESELEMQERVELVSQIEDKLLQTDAIETSFSAADFVPDSPKGRGLRSTIQRALYAKKLEQLRSELLEGDHLAATKNAELWRITARVYATKKVDFVELTRQAKERVSSTIEHESAEGVTAHYTGLPRVYYEGRSRLLSDLLQNYGIAFLLVIPVMAIALRSLVAGVGVMVPNVLPTALVFGGMALFGSKLDLAAVVTASLALGIAVDDTAHFVLRYRDFLSTKTPRDALAATYRQCSKAILHTTMICGLGLLAFVMSPLRDFQRFGVIIFLLMVAAVISDLLVLPAMLSGRLGKLIQSRP